MQTFGKSKHRNSYQLLNPFVDIKIMTPEEYRNHSKSLTVNYSTFATKFGLCLVASTRHSICTVLFSHLKDVAISNLRSRWPKANIVHTEEKSHAQVKDFLKGVMPEKKIPLYLHGTDFQIKVWKILLSIPKGKVTTYGDIARRIGNKNLSRAVGGAVGNNPIGYLIPCHRVLKSTGEIGGYRWGISRKKSMLNHESKKTDA